MTRLRAERQPGMASARVISFDEMWTYVGARRGEKRREVWIRTPVVEEADGRRWGCFEVGDRSEETPPGCLCNCRRPGDTAALIR